MSAIHCHVHGQVQGVGYRWSSQQQAQQLGVTGWVRNLPGGQVEVWAEGADDAVQALADWCRQGPRWARVDQLDVRPATARGYDAFEVR